MGVSLFPDVLALVIEEEVLSFEPAGTFGVKGVGGRNTGSNKETAVGVTQRQKWCGGQDNCCNCRSSVNSTSTKRGGGGGYGRDTTSAHVFRPE